MSAPVVPAPSPSLRSALAQEFVARVLACGRFLELLQRVPGGVGELGGDLDIHLDEQVTLGAVGSPYALAPDPEGTAVRRARRDPDRHGHPAVGRHLDLGAQRGLGKGHRHGDGQVVTVTAEDRMPGDVHPYVEITWRSAALTGRAFGLDLDPLAVGDSGRYPGLYGPRAHRPPAAGAGRARIVDNQATAAAGRARLGEREVSQIAARLPGALAGRADLRHRARLRAGASAYLARALVSQPERYGRAVDRVAEAQRRFGLNVGAAPRARLLGRGGPAAAEHAAEQVAKPPARSRRAKDVAQVERSELAPATARRPGARAE